ncbi:TIGR00645 family protein [Paraburkholderia sp. Ac-20340]|uniref:TIGR00645 family protein n=1 Tax=Paraburkholderia sp. Ac-20340 TaxID=2703888 RepID=UPI0019820392|nr:TIGR00645 family protein [Paraburkholderia sp. Ac-20340]MBN3853240.1 TIGR00645 family protein [Paraburkholderia sp. Ac-20340]
MRPTEKTEGHASNLAERLVEHGIFASRWVLAPIYVGLALGLIMLLVKFCQEFWHMATGLLGSSVEDVILGVLSLIDLSLMANLLLMIIFGGYQNFVSRLELGGHEDTPEWISHVGFSDIKLKLMASIVAISAIEVLRGYLSIEKVGLSTILWGIAVHMTFVLSAVLLAGMDWITAKTRAIS